jgi:hypothetical protein
MCYRKSDDGFGAETGISISHVDELNAETS